MALRYLYLVRHGQYNMDKESPSYGSLTHLGHYQSNCIAKRLLDYEVTSITTSTLDRAKETGLSILEKFSGLEIKNNQLLKEGLPYVPQKVIKQKNIDKMQIKLDKERMENAFKFFFVRNLKSKERHDVLVCHGNIIRFFICKCLGVPIEAWSNFEILECSMSVIKIKDNGSCIVNSVGECGHIPIHKRSIL